PCDSASDLRPDPWPPRPARATASPRRQPTRARGTRTAPASTVPPLEQEDTGRCPAARRDDSSLYVLHLTLACVVAQLGDGFVQEPEAVRPPLRQLPAVRVDGQLPVEGDPTTAVDPVLGLADAAEAEGLEPG